MNFTTFLVELSRALASNNGNRIAYLLSATGPGAQELLKDLKETTRLGLLKYQNVVESPWDEVGIAHVQVIVRISEGNFVDAYTEQATMAKAFERAFIGLQAWVLPALFVVLKDLRDLAEKADDSRFQEGQGSDSPSLEDAARICNKAFTDCVMDRNIIRALSANKDIPPLQEYPRSDQVTFKYYVGMLNFLNERYDESEQELSFAFDMCHHGSTRNQELILNYLIPLRLMRGNLPSPGLLHLFPRLQELYTPFLQALRSGNVTEYDAALDWAEPRLVEMGVYLAVEKAREICMRGLFRKVWKLLNKDSRIQIEQFHKAFRLSGQDMPMEETECLLANMIFKGYVKGYISHERQTVVLAKGDAAFPKLNDSQPAPAPAAAPPPVPYSAPPHTRSFSVQSQSGVPPPPPPYATTDPDPGIPPPVPPRDRTFNGKSNNYGWQDSSPARRVSYHPPSSFNNGMAAPAVNTTGAAQTRSLGQHTRSASAGHRQPPPRVDWRAGRSPVDSSAPPGSFMRPIPEPHDSQESRSSGGSMNTRGAFVPADAGLGSILGNPVRSESPPPVSPRGQAPVVPPRRRPSIEDPLELLRRYDTVIIVDDSTSMDGPLWYEARDALAGIAEVAARYDLDGIDVHFLNNPIVGRGLRNGTEVKQLFDQTAPYGITPTGEKLEELLLDYLIRLEDAKTAQLNGDVGALKRVKPVSFLVITDGAATDDPESVIVQAARRLDEGRFPLSQVGIQFVQIGTDEDAAEALRVLDDDLATVHGVRDIVDTYPYTAEGSQLTADSLAKILLGGINRRLDRRKPSMG
ncbi:COP9 signalosome (CSN) subunit [Tulasnella sp. 417]|nr:COP9 signalosome (CSN) subunit [Tulasnella sp. 417]